MIALHREQRGILSEGDGGGGAGRRALPFECSFVLGITLFLSFLCFFCTVSTVVLKEVKVAGRDSGELTLSHRGGLYRGQGREKKLVSTVTHSTVSCYFG